MSTLVVKWYASDELRQREAVETGQTGPTGREFHFPLEDMSREQRAAVLPLARLMADGRRFEANVCVEHRDADGQGYWSQQNIYWDNEPSLVDLIPVIQRVAAAQEASDRARAARRAADEAEQAQRQAQRQAEYAAHEAEAAARVQAQSEFNALRDAEKARWIAALGSDHLKRAFAAGYDSQRQYVVERAAAEWPGWRVDFNDTAGWDERVFPSVEALDAEDQAKARVAAADEPFHRYGVPRVVWLTAEPSDSVPGTYGEQIEEYEYAAFDPVEAVVVEGYLGNYTLVMVF